MQNNENKLAETDSIVPDAYEEEVFDDADGSAAVPGAAPASASANSASGSDAAPQPAVVLDVSSAENGVVRMQAQARGMLARKHDVKELAQASTVTKAEAKAERQRALGKAGASDDAASPAVL